MELRVKKYIRYLFGIALLVFGLNKFILRPWLLEHDAPNFFLILTFSIPNFVEAIVGTVVLTGIFLRIRNSLSDKIASVKDVYIHILAVSTAALYVITQELKIHNLGGNNIYDPNDLIASIIGLVLTFGLIQVFGFIEDENDVTKTR